jgi:cobalt-zinc-cadmium efflux system membrane fusion protein
VYSLVSGRIESLKVELGDRVRKGQVLAVLRSSEVANASNDLSQAKSNLEMAKKSYESVKDLYESRLATEQDLINAKLTYTKAQSELNKAREIATITGGQQSTSMIVSPLDGYVVEKNITASSAVRSDNSAELFAVADLSRVWVIANVYEPDMVSLHLGDSVKVTTLASPDKEYSGKIDKIYNVLDAATRTMKIRVSLPNYGGELKPEMFAVVRVNIQPSGSSLCIPSQAIVMENSRNYVVIRNNNQLSVREITVQKRIEDKAYITGLNAGEQVVTGSQVFLYQALTNK